MLPTLEKGCINPVDNFKEGGDKSKSYPHGLGLSTIYQLNYPQENKQISTRKKAKETRGKMRYNKLIKINYYYYY